MLPVLHFPLFHCAGSWHGTRVLLFPAIDLMSGQVVRLRQGKPELKTVYSNDPGAFARQWEAEGGDWLHLVDLDASFSGEQRNLESVRAITSAVRIPCELGGGIRTPEAIERALEAGVARVILGTKAAESLEFVRDMARAFGRDRIAVGIDAKNGIVSVKGWTQETGQNALDLAKRAVEAGAGTIIYTDIATDGMLQGPNVAETEKVNAAVTALGGQVIASGGIGTPAHVERIAALPGIYGCIIGKALYDKTLNLRDVVALK
jgi:phosphoribosylformimino-5-aminoimidazole carboxamide ribotide isomerase